MGPDEICGYMGRFKTGTSNIRSSSGSKNSGFIRTTETSIKQIEEEELYPRRHETSLNKNTINTPKNMRRFTFMKGTSNNLSTNTGGTTTYIEEKNMSLPKTASTINNQRTYTALESDVDRKQISKELLSQVHFCRFVYKLLQRINSKIDGRINQSLKDNMSGLIFQKLNQVQRLANLEEPKAGEYRKTSDYQKICQIVEQYQKKYEKEIGLDGNWEGYTDFQTELAEEIKQMFEDVKDATNLEERKEKVIILDYLITLRQLASLLSKDNLELFHNKSKIEAIVEGAPAKVITNEHVRAISAKMRAIKLI